MANSVAYGIGPRYGSATFDPSDAGSTVDLIGATEPDLSKSTLGTAISWGNGQKSTIACIAQSAEAAAVV